MSNIVQILNTRLPILEESHICKSFKNLDMDRISHIKFIGNLQNIYEKELKQSQLNELKLYTYAENIKNMHIHMMKMEDKSLNFVISKLKKNLQASVLDFNLSCYLLPLERTDLSYNRMINEIDRLIYFRKRCITYMEKEIKNNNWEAIKAFYIAIGKLMYRIYNLETGLRKLIIL
jgi:hypothetical protein